MNIVEEHFVPAMFASVRERHQIMKQRMRTFWIFSQEVLPWMRMVEVRDKHPSNGVTTASEESNREEKRETIMQDEVTEKVDAEPQAANK